MNGDNREYRYKPEGDDFYRNKEDMKKAIASQKSYIIHALITFLLYWFFYIPGLIFNILALNEAEKTARISGEKPSGMGCLQFMLYIQAAVVILVVLFFLLPCSMAIFKRA